MRALAIAALIVGALLRILILPIGVPAVDDSWRAWSYHAAMRGPWNLYGPRGHTVKFAGIDAPVVYPPLALDELAIVGRVHMAMHGQRFEDGVALTRTIKGTIVLLDAALATLLFTVVAANWRLAARVVGGDDVLGEPRRNDDHDARLHRRVFRSPGCRRPRRRIERPSRGSPAPSSRPLSPPSRRGCSSGRSSRSRCGMRAIGTREWSGCASPWPHVR